MGSMSPWYHMAAFLTGLFIDTAATSDITYMDFVQFKLRTVTAKDLNHTFNVILTSHIIMTCFSMLSGTSIIIGRHLGKKR